MDKYTEYAIASSIYYGGTLWRKYKNFTLPKEKSILVVSFAALGDFICGTPFFRNLRGEYPDYRITLLCSPAMKNLMEICPYIDEIMTMDTHIESHRFMTFVKRCLRFAKENFATRNFSIAILPCYDSTGVYPDSYLSLLSGADKRVTYSEYISENMHEYFMGLHDKFFNVVSTRQDFAHEVESRMGLLSLLTGKNQFDTTLEMWTTDEDKTFVDELFSSNKIDNTKINIVVCPVTSAKHKDWPIQKYVDLCKKIVNNYKINLILLGAGGQALNCGNKFMQELPTAYNLINKTTIRQSIEVMKRCQVHIGGDTGTMHMAAALGLQGVAIYKDAKDINKNMRADIWYGPWRSELKIVQPRHNLPGCEYECMKEHHCIGQITADEVFVAVKGILDNLQARN